MAIEFPAVSLVRYAQRILYRECAFNGVDNGEDREFTCRRIWTLAQRDDIAHYLAEAQEEIEQVTRFPLRPRWFTAERHNYTDPILTLWARVIEGGVMSDTLLFDAEPVDYTGGEPATIGPIDIGTCPLADVRFFHDGTDIEVIPSASSIDPVTGDVTFSFPFCRLVAPAYLDNPPGGWDYADVATWGAVELDVRCITNGPSTHASMIWRHDCSALCASRGCSHWSQTACMYVQKPRIGVVDVSRADYVSNAWVRRTTGRCDLPQWVELNYHAGWTALSRQAEDAVIRLAHSKMPKEPCGCEVTQSMWQRDRFVPSVITRERENCDFGMSDGAWQAYRFARAMEIKGGSVL